MSITPQLAAMLSAPGHATGTSDCQNRHGKEAGRAALLDVARRLGVNKK
jgi:hypothetical protein